MTGSLQIVDDAQGKVMRSPAVRRPSLRANSLSLAAAAAVAADNVTQPSLMRALTSPRHLS